MNDPKDKDFNPLARPPSTGKGMTRRTLFTWSAAGAVGAAATIHATWPPAAEPPMAIEKASKKVARYYEKPMDSPQNCTSCHFYVSPDECILVEGQVSPWGMCDYWVD